MKKCKSNKIYRRESKIRSEKKRAFRKVRSRIKKNIRAGASPRKHVLSKYRLKRFRGGSINALSKMDLINRVIDQEIPLAEIDVPKVLCFLRAPENTSKFLNDLNQRISTKEVQNINVIHRNTTEIGLSASWLFDEYIKSARNKYIAEKKKFHLRGTTSAIRRVNNFLMAFGFLKEMNIDKRWLKDTYDPDYKTKFKHFKAAGSKKITYRKGNACTELVNYFDNCLSYFHKKLTKDGREKLVDAFGEIIGNAEEHGGTEVEWHVLGCFEKDTNYCNFAIINRGHSIYQTLSDAMSTTRPVLEKIEKVVLNHRNFLQKAEDFLLKDEKWIETIWNVMALQEGISSKRTEDAEGDTRGQGMMDVLEFIAEIRAASADAQVAIISGHSYILVDYDYPIRRVHVGKQKEVRRQISFNSQKDLHLPQDKNKVKYLEHPFLGTIITGRFKLSHNYVIETNSPET